MARNPTITASVRDTNSVTIALTGNSNKLIRYASIAEASMTATAYDGAVINNDMYIIRNGSQTGYGDTSTFYNVESEVFSFSAEDSNGNVGSANVIADMIPYVMLTCNAENNRPSSDGTMTLECSGTFYNGSFGAKSNTLSVTYTITPEGGSTSAERSMIVSTSGNKYTAYANLSGLDVNTGYKFVVHAADALSWARSSSAVVRSYPVFHWSGTDFTFEVPVKVNGTLDASEILVNGEPIQSTGGSSASDTLNNMWTPALDSYAVASYITRRAWYSAVGKVVTVGFYIKADCYSGYENYDVIISGLPYTPYCSASGGGICSGAYVPAGFSFQCFVAEGQSNEITVRVQSTDGGYDGNLVTSASGCGYPEGGGEITLSGTISYITNDL